MATKPSASLKDRLKSRAAKPTVEKPAAKKKERISLELTPEEKEVCDRMAAFSEIEREAEALRKSTYAIVSPMLAEKVILEWLAVGHRTENPAVHTGKSDFNFTSADTTSKFKVPATANGEVRTFEQFMKDNEVPPKVIKALSAEVTEKEIQEIASPDNIEEKWPDLADKMREAILGVLDGCTDEQFAAVVKTRSLVTIKKGFADRLPGIVKLTTKQHEALPVIRKVMDLTKAIQFRIGQIRCHDLEMPLRAVADKIAGTHSADGKMEEFFTTEKDYKMEVTGSNVVLFVVSGGDLKKVGERKCEDNDHAKNTVKKWIRDRDTLVKAQNEMQP